MLSISSWSRVYSSARVVRFAKDATADGVISVFAGFMAVLLARGGLENVGPAILLPSLIAAVGLVATMFGRSMYSLNKRYFGYYDAVATAQCAAFAAMPIALGEYFLQGMSQPWEAVRAAVLYQFIATGAIVYNRVNFPHVTFPGHKGARSKTQFCERITRVLVVGAGDAGETMVREYARHRRGVADVAALVDDDPTKFGLRIHRVPVLGTCADIPRLVRELAISEILVAVPSATGPQMRKIHETCRGTGLAVRTLPGLSSLREGSDSLSSQLREIRIEDLLARAPVCSDTGYAERCVRGERILITGGGGSIGSELARQVAKLEPAELILLGKGENSLHQIQQELLQTGSVVPHIVVADVRDRALMRAVFRQFRPTVVFHAAAHKHVPLMESNLREAIRNNVYGTLVAAEVSVEFDVSRFILVSSDKAVRPGGVMGATKRVCEMIVSAFGREAHTTFAAVRFGNVLGSRGSLVPVLSDQIKRGGPVTVTHPDMTRYFMTIPEAAHLVLQAGAMGTGGDIFILDMGEPVRIDDLARDLIRLHGLVPDQDIAVRYTGIRPGEKLHEELVYKPEELRATRHEKIRRVAEAHHSDITQMKSRITRLLDIVEDGRVEEARGYLMELTRDNFPRIGERTYLS